LRELLLPHLLRTGRRDDDVVFGSTATEPFNPTDLTKRTDAAWTAAKLRRITLHECRHTFASYMIAAGVNVKALSTFMGHASVAFTLDRYGHLFPGAESEAGGLLDAYLGAAGGQGAYGIGPHHWPAPGPVPLGNRQSAAEGRMYYI
jgi:integrase